MKKCFVVGKPVYHSKSPQIFGELFEKCGIEGTYSRLNLNEFDEIFHIASQVGIDFANITAPFKNRAFQLCTEKGCNILHEALLSEAVNSIFFENGQMSICTNTDVSALLSIFGSVFEGFAKGELSIAILGAGGAARAALSALKILSERKNLNLVVSIFNRTYQKAQSLCEKFTTSQFQPQAESLEMFVYKYKSFDTVVNCLTEYPNAFKNLEFEERQVFIDANYKSPVNVKIAKYLPGEVWLVKQALDSFLFLTKKDIKECILNSLYYSLLEKITDNRNSTPKRKIIYLVGMPGSGKSTIGRLLARELGFTFIDTDELIQERAKMSISDIFSTYSEDYFRTVETSILKDVSKLENCVIATGGGIVLKNENVNLIKQGHVVWLLSSIDECARRLDDKNDRPLLRSDSREDLLQKFFSLFSTRVDLYFRVADLIFPVDRSEIYQVVDELKKELSFYV
ncbi:MAG: AAA family ATPase [Fervidobacterium sp.]|nr:AAA family ATPase [Fervidobacterium sp.]